MKVWIVLACVLVVGCKKNLCGEGISETNDPPIGAWATVGKPEGATMCAVNYGTPQQIAAFPSPEAGDRAVEALLTSKGYKKLPPSKKLAKRELDDAVGGHGDSKTTVFAKDGDPVRLYADSSHAIKDRGWISLYTADCGGPAAKGGYAEYCED
jgi:hypothetical protein